MAVTTTIAASAAAIVALLWRKVIDKKWDLPSFLNGLLTGLVSITAGCAFVDIWVGPRAKNNREKLPKNSH